MDIIMHKKWSRGCSEKKHWHMKTAGIMLWISVSHWTLSTLIEGGTLLNCQKEKGTKKDKTKTGGEE